MKPVHLTFALFLITGTLAIAQLTFAQSSSNYAWRLDEVTSTFDETYISDWGDTIYAYQLVRYYYGDSSFYKISYPMVDQIKDTFEIYRQIVKTEYDQIGANGKHREKTFNLRLPRGVDNNFIRYLDSIPHFDPLADTVIIPLRYYDYAYDTYRNVYDNDGHLLRQIHNYDYTQYELDSDSLLRLIEKYKDTGDLPLSEFNRLPYDRWTRYVMLETDSNSVEMSFQITDSNSESSDLPAQYALLSMVKKEYTNHILSMRSDIDCKYYRSKPSRVTKSTRYNKYGIKTGYSELTERWTVDSVPTYYSLTDETYLGGDSVIKIWESRTWSTDTAGVQHQQITREERIYDSSINQTLYTKKTVTTDGIEKIHNEEEWAIEITEKGKKAHLLYQDKLTPVNWYVDIKDSNNVWRTIDYYTIYCESVKRYQYDDRFNIIFAIDSAQTRQQYADSVMWEGHTYSTYIYRPAWTEFSRSEYEYDADNTLIHEKQYTHGFIEQWFLTKESLITDDYTWSMSVNTKDTTRTTSKKYANGWDSESTKEKLDIASMDWNIIESSKYVVTFDLTGEPVSAVSASTKRDNTKTDRTYYLFHHWDETEQRYIRQSVAWSRYDTADAYSDETIHPYDCQDYTYYDRNGKFLGYFENCVSHYLPITSESVTGVFNKPHFDSQGRMDTLYRYAFYGEWFLVRYFTYEYFPEEGTDVVARRHSYSLNDDQMDEIDYYNTVDLRDYEWVGLRWHRRLSGKDTLEAPLHDMQFVGTTNYSHTYSTYNEDGVLLETRTYNDGSMTPVTQIHNTFTYDAEGRITTHVAYKDSFPDTRYIYFYSEQTGERIACNTWSDYDKENNSWNKFAFTNYGEHFYDAQGRLSIQTNYQASADSTTIVPFERYEFLYEDGETDWVLSDKYAWQDNEWVCATPTYRGHEQKHYLFDEYGNLAERTERQAVCGGLAPAQTWQFTYASPLTDYSLLSPQTYGIAETNTKEIYTNEEWLSRPLTAHYTHSSIASMNYTVRFHYTALRPEPVRFNEPVEVEPEEESAFFTWPKVDGAAGYSLVIWADEAHTRKLCTVVFDARGTVLCIDFSHAPSRHSSRTPSRYSTPTASLAEAVPSVAIWQTEFTHLVEGLESGTTYWYTLIAFDEQNHTLDTRAASFTTKGVKLPTDIDEVQTTHEPCTHEQCAHEPCTHEQCTKFLRNGHLYIQRGAFTYSLRGIIVSAP